MDIRRYSCEFNYKYKTDEDTISSEFTNGACHQVVENHQVFEFTAQFYHNETKIELVKEWLKLLKTIGINATYNHNFEEEYTNSITFHKGKSKKWEYSKKALFAWQLIRLVLKNSTFVERVLENAKTFDKMNAWDLIYITWNDQPINEVSWYDYYDSFKIGKRFKYLPINRLLTEIKNTRSISNLFYSYQGGYNKVWLKTLKNAPLKGQIRECNLEQFILYPRGDSDHNRMFKGTTKISLYSKYTTTIGSKYISVYINDQNPDFKVRKRTEFVKILKSDFKKYQKQFHE